MGSETNQKTSPNRKDLENHFGYNENGATLVETLIAFFVFSIVSLGIFAAVKNVIHETNLVSTAPAIFEHDQIVRFEISTVMDQFQRLLVINDTNDVNSDGFIADSEIAYCTNPLEKLKRAQQNFVFPRTIYWGPKDFLESESGSLPTMKKFNALISDASSKSIDGPKNKLVDALRRCKSSVSSKASTSNHSGRSSLYQCGYGRDLLVELKISFWDFLRGRSVTCMELNEQAGRGIKAVYSYYSLEPYSSNGKKMYKLSTYSSKLFIPKKVDLDTSINRGLWK